MTPILSRKTIIITAIVAGIAFLGLLAAVTSKRPAGSDATSSPAVSGKPTTSNPTPTPVAATEPPTFGNIDSIVNRGVSAAQVDSLKWAFFAYIQANHLSAQVVTIDSSSLTKAAHDPSSDIFTLNFNASFDTNLTVKAQLDYSNLTDVRLRLFNITTSAALYDSGTISGKQIQT